MKHAFRDGTILLGMGGIVVACSVTMSPSTGGGSTSQTVGAGGGTVTASDGTQVVIPAGALTSDVTITIALNAAAPALSQAESIATAHVFGPEGQQFLEPITVTLGFESLPTGVPESAIVVYTAPQGSTAYQPLPTTVLDPTHVTAQTTHFSNMLPAIPGTGDDGGATDGGASSSGSGSSGGGTCVFLCEAAIGNDCESTYGGHSYSMACTCDPSTQAGACTCSVDGSEIGNATTSACESQSWLGQAFAQACGIPCSFSGSSGGSGSSSGGSGSGGGIDAGAGSGSGGGSGSSSGGSGSGGGIDAGSGSGSGGGSGSSSGGGGGSDATVDAGGP